jgi:hypothetical protein
VLAALDCTAQHGASSIAGRVDHTGYITSAHAGGRYVAPMPGEIRFQVEIGEAGRSKVTLDSFGGFMSDAHRRAIAEVLDRSLEAAGL